jgi:excisionase family DNA binding protein
MDTEVQQRIAEIQKRLDELDREVDKRWDLCARAAYVEFAEQDGAVLESLEDLMTVNQAAVELNTTYRTILRHLNDGSIKGVRVKGKRMIESKAIQEFLNYMTTSEAAAYLGVNTKTVYRQIKSGRITVNLNRTCKRNIPKDQFKRTGT